MIAARRLAEYTYIELKLNQVIRSVYNEKTFRKVKRHVHFDLLFSLLSRNSCKTFVTYVLM